MLVMDSCPTEAGAFHSKNKSDSCRASSFTSATVLACEFTLYAVYHVVILELEIWVFIPSKKVGAKAQAMMEEAPWV